MTEIKPSEQKEKKSFWDTTIGTITKITALLTAVTGLILAYNALTKSWNNNSPPSINSNTTTPESVGNNTIVKPPISLHVFTPPEIRDFLDAATIGNVDILKKDLDLGLNADITLNDDRTALGNAVLNNKPEAAKILLERNADPNIKINENSYLIIEASYGGYNEIVDFLIQHKADLNKRKQDGSGITPLMFACIRGNKEIVQKLINGNADPNLKSGQNSTALDYANELPSPSKEQIVAILNSVGALTGH